MARLGDVDRDEATDIRRPRRVLPYDRTDLPYSSCLSSISIRENPNGTHPPALYQLKEASQRWEERHTKPNTPGRGSNRGTQWRRVTRPTYINVDWVICIVSTVRIFSDRYPLQYPRVHLRPVSGRAVHGDQGQRCLPERDEDAGGGPGDHRGSDRGVRGAARGAGSRTVRPRAGGAGASRANHSDARICR